MKITKKKAEEQLKEKQLQEIQSAEAQQESNHRKAIIFPRSQQETYHGKMLYEVKGMCWNMKSIATLLERISGELEQTNALLQTIANLFADLKSK